VVLELPFDLAVALCERDALELVEVEVGGKLARLCRAEVQRASERVHGKKSVLS